MSMVDNREPRYSPEPQSPLVLPHEKFRILIERLGKLTTDQLYDHIRGPILDAENKAFTRERNTGLHKLVFVTGGPLRDISMVRDESGNSVCKDPQPGIRHPEISEAITEIENNLNEIELGPTKAYSEIIDLTHNLILLTVLDQDAELSYNGQKITYEDCINDLAESLDLEVRDLLRLSAIKYTQRLGSGKKNPQAEEKLIRTAIEELAVLHPTKDSLKKARETLLTIDCILQPRVALLAKEKGWTLTSPKNSNHIFK